ATLAAQKGMHIGNSRLMRWLRKRKILMPNNLPYQKYIDCGYFEVKAISENRCTKRRAFVTGKGQIYLINRLRCEYLDDHLEEV
ncbi:MAG: phage antirepressor KilAC domain-containing protein, partial [Oscillospiraceae bacterium]|nr:phage antirepressor KilAC domain-containing protein [Oscillospiraceae bacterium]